MLAQMREREEKVKPEVSFEVGETVKVGETAASKTRAASWKKSIRNAAASVSRSPSSAAPPRSNSNTGRSNAAKEEEGRRQNEEVYA